MAQLSPVTIKNNQNRDRAKRRARLFGEEAPCPECKKLVPLVGPWRGYCRACYRQLRRNGELPPRAPNRKPERVRYPWDSQAELDLYRHLGRHDFWFHFNHVFGAGANPKGLRWIDDAVHRPIAAWVEKHILDWHEKRENGVGEQKHLAVLIHREVGKTTMISQAVHSWLQVMDPEIAVAVGSEKLPMAKKIIGPVLAVMDGSDPYAMFTKLYGNWEANARQWSGIEIVHGARKNTARRDPSISIFGVETSITGSHPDVIIYDDPISYERMATDTDWLLRVNEQVSSLFPVIQKDGLVIWVGTRYDDGDHFGVAFREEGIKSLAGIESDQLEVDPDGKWDVYFLAGRDKEGKPTTPKVWPESRLRDYQRRDPLKYAAQVMNDPQLSEFNPLTKEQILQCVVEPKEVPWHALKFGITMDYAFWDGKTRVKKDDTVFIVHGYPMNGSGDVYVVEAHGSPLWRAEDFGHRLVACVQRYRKQGRRIIGMGGDKINAMKTVWESQLRNYFADANEPMPPYFEFQRGVDTKKVQRMVNAAGFWVDGHVRVVKDAPGVDQLMAQMARVGQFMVNPRMKNDYCDAHADAFQPSFYNPMKRLGNQKAPYERGSIPLSVDGLDREMFESGEDAEWEGACPRPPIR